MHAESKGCVVYRRYYNVGTCRSHSIDYFQHLDRWQLDSFVQYSSRRREFGLSDRGEHRSGRHNYESYKQFDLVANTAGRGRVRTGFLLPIGTLRALANGQVPMHGEQWIERL